MNSDSLHHHNQNSYLFYLNEFLSSKLTLINNMLAVRYFIRVQVFLGVFSLIFLHCENSDATPRGDEGKLIGSVTGDIKTGGQWLRDEGSGTPRSVQNLDMIWGVTPSLDYALNHFIWIGGEIAISWLREPNRQMTLGTTNTSTYTGGQRMIFTPALRGRIDFPIDCRWIIEGNFSLGMTLWGATRNASDEAYDERRWGFSWQSQLGLRYVLNTQVHAFLGGGYAEQLVYLDSGSISVSAFPISLGLRGGF